MSDEVWLRKSIRCVVSSKQTTQLHHSHISWGYFVVPASKCALQMCNKMQTSEKPKMKTKNHLLIHVDADYKGA